MWSGIKQCGESHSLACVPEQHCIGIDDAEGASGRLSFGIRHQAAGGNIPPQ
jgi:hypothetical protein